MLKVDILYNANEYRVEVNKSKNNDFSSFLLMVKEKLEIKEMNSNLKLMTINSKERFLILSEDNYTEIINEKFNGNILKLCANIISIDDNENINIKVIDDFDSDLEGNYSNPKNKEEEEKELDSLFPNNMTKEEFDNEFKLFRDNIEHSEKYKIEGENKDENKKEFDIKINDNEDDDNNNEKKYIEENKEKDKVENKKPEEKQINSIDNSKRELKELPEDSKDLLSNSLNSSNIPKSQKVHPHPIKFYSHSSINEYVKNKGNKAKKINKNNKDYRLLNWDSFNNEKCSICRNNLGTLKYVCCVCDNTNLCEHCEEGHSHPTFKYKSHFLSNLRETYFFIQSKQNIQSKNIMKKIFSKEIELAITPLIDYDISMKPRQICKLPFLIENLSKNTIYSKDLDILIKNYKIIRIFYEDLVKFTIPPKKSVQINLLCHAENKIGQERVTIELFSNTIKIKDTSKRVINVNIDVNDDQEEKKLNHSFFQYDKIKLLKKKYKSMILYIMNEQLTKKGPLEILEVLKKNNWILEKAVKDLTEKIYN